VAALRRRPNYSSCRWPLSQQLRAALAQAALIPQAFHTDSMEPSEWMRSGQQKKLRHSTRHGQAVRSKFAQVTVCELAHHRSAWRPGVIGGGEKLLWARVRLFAARARRPLLIFLCVSAQSGAHASQARQFSYHHDQDRDETSRAV